MQGARGIRGAIAAVGLAVLASMIVACGGDGEGGGAGGAQETVEQFVKGWQRASGPTRDDISAGQLRRLLTGEMRDQTEGIVAGGSNPRTGADFGQTRRLDKIYNEFMLLPIPPDEGFEVVESTTEGEESAVVIVRLLYSPDAAGVAAASGLIPFEEVNQANQQIVDDPTRRFRLVQVEGEWRIIEITEG